jgi:hypothetical protein
MANNRREFLLLWAQAAMAAQGSSAGKFLSEAERATLNRAAAILVPATERSGGAAAAGVDTYIDFVLSQAPAKLQDEWRAGLKTLGAAKNLESTIASLAKREFAPRTRDDWFFVLLKGAVVEGFYTSQEGIEKELGYQGMGHVMEFPDFTNTVTAIPGDYKPMLRTRG